MGRKREPGLEWLEPENLNQRQWARDYLLLRGRTKHFEYREKVQPDTPYSHEEMLKIGGKIEQEDEDEAYKLFQGMKRAWRQERSRQRKKETGHKACLFTLNGQTKDKLKQMAKELDTDATALLEKLITKAYKAHQRKQDEQSSKSIFEGRTDVSALMTRPTPSPEANSLATSAEGETDSVQIQASPENAGESESRNTTGVTQEQAGDSLAKQAEDKSPCDDLSPGDLAAGAMREEAAPLNNAVQDLASAEFIRLPEHSAAGEEAAPAGLEPDGSLAKNPEGIQKPPLRRRKQLLLSRIKSKIDSVNQRPQTTPEPDQSTPDNW